MHSSNSSLPKCLLLEEICPSLAADTSKLESPSANARAGPYLSQCRCTSLRHKAGVYHCTSPSERSNEADSHLGLYIYPFRCYVYTDGIDIDPLRDNCNAGRRDRDGTWADREACVSKLDGCNCMHIRNCEVKAFRMLQRSGKVMAQEHSNAWCNLHAHLTEGMRCLAILRHGALGASISAKLSPMHSP